MNALISSQSCCNVSSWSWLCPSLHLDAASENQQEPEKKTSFDFSQFPLNNKPLLKKWLNAVKRKGFVPTHYHRLCSDHFTARDYWIGGERRNLKNNAIPSIFNFPEHLQSKERMPRRELHKEIVGCTNSAIASDFEELRFEVTGSTINKEHNYTFSSSPSKIREKMEKVIERKQCTVERNRSNLTSSISKCSRQSKKIEKLTEILKKLEDEKLVNEWTAGVLQDNFGAVFTEMLNRSFSLSHETSYSETLKKFALTLHFYSPAAYNYVRETFNAVIFFNDWYYLTIIEIELFLLGNF